MRLKVGTLEANRSNYSGAFAAAHKTLGLNILEMQVVM